MVEGKVTLTCGHTSATPVGIWEPEIDREGNRCRSYSTYCPACAEDASLVMVKRIEELEGEVAKARAEGRRAGLEEAAKAISDLEDDYGEFAAIVALDRAHKNIRALVKTSTTPEGEE